MKILLALLLALSALASSCATVDIGRRVRGSGISTDGAVRPENAPFLLDLPSEREYVEVERPVYVPESEAPRRPPATGAQAVRESNSAGIALPSEYSHAAMVYDYSGDWVYEVYTQPLRATDVRLEPGERAVEPPFISDSDRWMLGAGVSFHGGIAVQHIYVKPTGVSLDASLIINTDRRVYHIILRSFRDVYMPMVRWRYPSTGMPSSYVTPPGGTASDPDSLAGIDPRFLSFNYRMSYGLFRKPAWLPELAFDDGQKTYIVFSESVLQRELPAIFENRRDVVNYRVVGRLIVIDKLVESITVRIERLQITIQKKRG
jgi:type IV secretion system protein VirB9